MQKLIKLFRFLTVAARTGAWGNFFDFLVYRSGLGSAWARFKGHRFHRSSLLWFVDDGTVRTRVALLLPRLKIDFPGLTSADLDLEFFDRNGHPVLKKHLERVALDEIFVLDAKSPPAWMSLPRPFEGSLLIKIRLDYPQKEIQRRQGFFSATHTYIDYYSEGRFVATLHDYCAFLPDQMQSADLGMIPAYCDASKETFLVIHAASYGIGKRDLQVTLRNSAGRSRTARVPALVGFAFRRLHLSDLFPDSAQFLAGGTGQVTVRGLFRQTLTRIAYGVTDKASGAFSLDHCFYNEQALKHRLSYAHRQKVPKGHFNPFFLIEDGTLSTSAILFNSVEGAAGKKVDLLIYDAEGKCVADRRPHDTLKRDVVCRMDFGRILKEAGVPTPFMGHAEVLYHASPEVPDFPVDLAVCVEYVSGGKFASVIFGAGLWNPPNAAPNRNYSSVNRVVCDEAQTTYIAISNCCYDYEGCTEASLKISLVSKGAAVAETRLRIPPNGTVFKAVDELFPSARALLAASGGAGLTLTTDINCLVLTHLFMTQDRVSKAVSVEHSLDL